MHVVLFRALYQLWKRGFGTDASFHTVKMQQYTQRENRLILVDVAALRADMLVKLSEHAGSACNDSGHKELWPANAVWESAQVHADQFMSESPSFQTICDASFQLMMPCVPLFSCPYTDIRACCHCALAWACND